MALEVLDSLEALEYLEALDSLDHLDSLPLKTANPEMKIAYIMETLAICGGLERIMTAKMNYLADNALCDVVLIEVYDYPGADAFPLSERVKRIRLGIKKHSLTIIKPMTFWQVTHRVDEVIRQEKPEIMTSAGLLGVYLYGLRRYPCRMIYESHQARFTMPLPWLVRRMEQHVDTVICLTDGDAQEYKHARRVAVIPNFIDMLPATCESETMREKKIVALGRLEKKNGYDLLIRAWYQIHHKMPEYTLHIYGEGRERKRLQDLVDSMMLSESTTLHHATDKPEDVYRSADIVCVTSVYEGFSFTTIEALAHGVPVVACDVPYGPAQLLGEGHGGLLVERNSEAVGNALLTLSRDRELYARLASEGMDIAQRYNKHNIMRQLIEELKKQ